MKFQSENINNWIMNKYRLNSENEITKEQLENIKSINLNKYNMRLLVAKFVPSELLYFKNLEEISFSQFLIDEELKINLEKIAKLRCLKFDFCKNEGQYVIKNDVERIELNCSDIELLYMCKNKIALKEAFINDSKNIIDIKELLNYINIEKITILNSKVVNESCFGDFEKLKELKIIGCEMADTSVFSRLNIKVKFSKDKFVYTN